MISITPYQARLALDAPMEPNDAKAATVGDFLKMLLVMVLEEGECFSGKRPFGNSGWEQAPRAALVKAGLVEGEFDDDGYLTWCNYERADALLIAAARHLK